MKPFLIAIVDDSITSRMSVGRLFEDSNCRVIYAENGEQGEALLNEFPDIDLMLIDFNMPLKNGLEMLIEINKRHKQLPIIYMLTTETNRESAEIAKSSGASGWIIKPFKDFMVGKLVDILKAKDG